MTHTPPLNIHRGSDRGTTDLGWLRSSHSFSFGAYQDPARMGFRSLRVINDDIVAPGAGFDTHPHRDMEILTWVLDGALRHKDSTGASNVLVPGDLQVMTAGSGIRHSEFNDSESAPVHFLQIWIMPAHSGLDPTYAQRSFDADDRRDRWQLLVGPGDDASSLRIYQDASLLVAELESGDELSFNTGPGRAAYLHVVHGEITIQGQSLGSGDAVAVETPGSLGFSALAPSQVLRFDLA